MTLPRQLHPPIPDSIQTSIQKGKERPWVAFREALAYLLAFTLVVITVVFFLRLHAASRRQEELASWQARLSGVADDQAQRVSDWLMERQGDARVSATRLSVSAALRAYKEGGQPAINSFSGQPDLMSVLDSVADAYSYVGVYILSDDAHVVMQSGRAVPFNPALAESCREVARSGVARTELVGDAPGQTQLGFIAPVVSGPSPEPAQHPRPALGVVLLVSDASKSLFPLVMREVLPTRTGETILVRRAGNDIVFFSPLRNAGTASPNLRFPLSIAPMPAQLALKGRQSFVDINDYRGIRVLAATQLIPRTGWGLVRKIDRAEALKGFDRTLRLESVVAWLLIALLGGLLLLLRSHVTGLAQKRMESKFRALLESSPDAVYILEPATLRILGRSHKAQQLDGYTDGEIVRMTVTDLYPPVEYTLVRERIEKLPQSGGTLPVQFLHHRHKCGQLVPVEETQSLVDAAGERLILSSVRDITGRLQAEEAVRESERHFRSLFENMLNGFAYCKLHYEQGKPHDFTFVDVNQAFETLTGLKDVVGRRVSEVIPGLREADPELFEMYGRVALTGVPERIETFVAPLEMWFSIAAYSPKKEHFVAVFDVVTARKRAEIELRRLNRALRTISDCNQILVRAENETELLNQVCAALVREGGYRMAWVGFAEHDEGKSVRPVAVTGADAEYLQTARITWADTERGQGPAGRAIRTQKPVVARDIFTDPGFALWREDARRRGFVSSIALPLKIQDQVLGGLMVYAAEADAFDSQEVALLTELADDLAYGIHALRTRVEHQRGEERLREYEKTLEGLDEMIAVVDRDYRYVIANQAYLTMRGLAREQLIGQLVPDLSDRDLFNKVVKGKMDECFQGKVIKYEVKYTYPEIGEREMFISYFPIEGPRGIDRIACVLQDITERRRAEEELYQSHQMLKSILDTIPQRVFWTDRNIVYLGCNKALATDAGLKDPAEIIGKTDYELAWRESAETYRADDKQVMEQDAPRLDYEEIQKQPDGSQTWLITSKLPLHDREGHVIGILGTYEDFTERKRGEAKLRTSEIRYRRLFEAAHDGILILDVESGEINDVNPFITSLLGFTEAELVGRKLWDIGPLRDVLLSKISFAELQAKEHIRYDNLPLETRDGRHVDVEFVSNVYIAGDRKVIQCNIRDNTESKRAQAEHLRLVTAIEQSAEAVVITDTNGKIQYVNPAFTRITGYSREEALGQNPRVLKSGKHDLEFYQQLWLTILKGQPWHGELINQRKDGSLYTEEMSITPVRDDRGRVTHFIATKQDVTERKALEAQLQQAGRMEAVGRLAGGVAHDFNNLLTVINGYSEILLDKFAADPKVGGYLKEINDAGTRAAGLTRQLLAFSRKQVLSLQVLDLNAVVSNLEKMLRRLIGEDVHLHTQLQSGLGRIKADPGQIEQVVMNLAVNARDAMPMGGHLTLETTNVELDEEYVRTHPTVTPGPHVMLAVSDTGVGMTAETLSRIFEPFFTTKGQGKGTGLGLSTVYGIVKQSEGSIGVYSEPDHGTVFKIYFPMVDEGFDSMETEKVKMETMSGTETILMVEDEEGVRSLVNLALLSGGYKVLKADDGEAALAICSSHEGPIHLLLTDVVMPQMSGPEVAGKVAALRPGIKVLFMSGYTDDAVVRHGVLTQEMPFIQKPFTPFALRKKIREILGSAL